MTNRKYALSIGVVAVVQQACCSDFKDPSTISGDGGTSTVAPNGGTGAPSASAGSNVPAFIGGRNGSGGTGAFAGQAGTGGGAPSSTAPSFDALCTNDRAVGYVTGCLGVYASTYLSECVAQWEALAQACPSETSALARCWSAQDVLGFVCKDSRVVLASGVCVDETNAVAPCL